MGNFGKKLGYFLLQHLVTLDCLTTKTESKEIRNNDERNIFLI